MGIEKAKKILLDVVPSQVIQIHDAIGIFGYIGQHADTLNRTRWREILGTIQHHSLGVAVLETCKIFEQGNRKYPCLSIPTALRLLGDHSADIAVSETNQAFMDDHLLTYTDSSLKPREPLAQWLLEEFHKQCPQSHAAEPRDLDRALDRMLTLRDKRVAHSEDCEIPVDLLPDVRSIQLLISYASSTSRVVGLGLFGFTQDFSKSTPDDFDPAKSSGWSKISKMVASLSEEHRKR